MPRTIVYPPPRRAGDEGVLAGAEQVSVENDYFARLLKYVPAETIAFFLLVASNWPNDDSVLRAAVIAGAILTPAYLFMNGVRQPELDRPLPHYYLLSIVAFLAWAMGTSPPTADLLGLSAKTGSLILVFATFALPVVDFFIAHLFGRGRR